jgi:hypothetical protein
MTLPVPLLALVALDALVVLLTLMLLGGRDQPRYYPSNRQRVTLRSLFVR